MFKTSTKSKRQLLKTINDQKNKTIIEMRQCQDAGMNDTFACYVWQFLF
jgi:predicted transglutaminase-like cysteine proteinase